MELNTNKATIDDVAKKAGVSKTTVSRYLNGKFEYMSASTKKRIERVIEQLDYRPSNIARSLKATNSGVVGCVIADVTSPFSSYIVKGINDVCKKNGYRVLFVNTDNKEEDEIGSIQSLLDQRIDGLIVNTTGCNDQYLVELNEQGLPVVLADRCIKDRYKLDTITSDNYEATYNCIKFLHKQGYKKVAFFSESIGNISSRYVRHTAYLDALAKIYHLDGNDFTYTIDTKNEEICQAGIRQFIETYGDEPIAIFTVNGVATLNVLTGMQRLGYTPGKDSGICGFDDWGWAELISPGITTITQKSYETGIKCAELLLRRIKSGKPAAPKYVELPAELVVRGSTTPHIEKREESYK